MLLHILAQKIEVEVLTGTVICFWEAKNDKTAFLDLLKYVLI